GGRSYSPTGSIKSFDDRDSAPLMQKCRVIDRAFTWGSARKPETPWEQTIFYEMQVNGFTQLHLLVPESERGTFAGLAHPQVPGYLRSGRNPWAGGNFVATHDG